MPFTNHTEATKQQIRESLRRYYAIQRGELEIVEQPSIPDLKQEFQHTWVDLRVRLLGLCAVAEKTFEEIMSSPNVSARLVEVLNMTADGIARELGARNFKQQVEVSGQLDPVAVHASLLQKL